MSILSNPFYLSHWEWNFALNQSFTGIGWPELKAFLANWWCCIKLLSKLMSNTQTLALQFASLSGSSAAICQYNRIHLNYNFCLSLFEWYSLIEFSRSLNRTLNKSKSFRILNRIISWWYFKIYCNLWFHSYTEKVAKHAIIPPNSIYQQV